MKKVTMYSPVCFMALSILFANVASAMNISINDDPPIKTRWALSSVGIFECFYEADGSAYGTSLPTDYCEQKGNFSWWGDSNGNISCFRVANKNMVINNGVDNGLCERYGNFAWTMGIDGIEHCYKAKLDHQAFGYPVDSKFCR